MTGERAMLVLWSTLIVVLTLLFVAGYRTCRNRPTLQRQVPPMPFRLNRDRIVANLSRAIQIPTVIHTREDECDRSQWLRFHAFLEEAYPLVHAGMTREVVDSYGLLYRWPAAEPGEQPILLMAHIDVVPAATGTLGEWAFAPFSGAVEQGYIYGRGAVDMKGSLIAIMEACEELLRLGHKPRQDVYLSFGHDEEVAGRGARAAARELKHRGLRFAFVLDEGGYVIDGAPFGVSRPIAALGIAEKSYVDVIVEARQSGGHSSRPPRQTALGEVCTAVHRITRRPMRARIQGPTRAFLDAIAPYMQAKNRFVFSNIWLLSWYIKLRFARDPLGNALVRTTFAPTQAKGSVAPNVLPDCAKAVVNVRIAPWDTMQGVLNHMARAARNERLHFSTAYATQTSRSTDISSNAYGYVSRIVGRCFPECVVAPMPMLGATDARQFEQLSDCVVRFVPFRSMLEDAPSMHGVNERLAEASLLEGVNFFMNLIAGGEAFSPQPR